MQLAVPAAATIRFAHGCGDVQSLSDEVSDARLEEGRALAVVVLAVEEDEVLGAGV